MKRHTRRNRLFILMKLLEIAENPSLITHLQYKANTNNNVVKKFILILRELGLLTTITLNRRINYVTTDKGRRLLHVWKNEFRELRMKLREKYGHVF